MFRVVFMRRIIFIQAEFCAAVAPIARQLLTPIKADRPLTRDTLNTHWLLTNRQFQWTGNGHSQLPLAELGKPSPNIDLLRTTVLPWSLTYDLDLQSQASQGQGRPLCQKSRSNGSNRTAPTDKRTDKHTHTRTLPNVGLLSPLLRGR